MSFLNTFALSLVTCLTVPIKSFIAEFRWLVSGCANSRTGFCTCSQNAPTVRIWDQNWFNLGKLFEFQRRNWMSSLWDITFIEMDTTDWESRDFMVSNSWINVRLFNDSVNDILCTILWKMKVNRRLSTSCLVYEFWGKKSEFCLWTQHVEKNCGRWSTVSATSDRQSTESLDGAEERRSHTFLFIANRLGFVLLLRHKTLCDRLI